MTSKRNYCKNKILFRNLAKFLIPKLTRFKTRILLLYPSIKPLDKLVFTILVISVLQLVKVLIQCLNSGMSNLAANKSHILKAFLAAFLSC